MKNVKAKKSPTATTKIKVLYQNLGGVWYAFAAADEDNVFVGRVPVQASTRNSDTKEKKSGKNSRGIKPPKAA